MLNRQPLSLRKNENCSRFCGTVRVYLFEMAVAATVWWWEQLRSEWKVFRAISIVSVTAKLKYAKVTLLVLRGDSDGYRSWISKHLLNPITFHVLGSRLPFAATGLYQVSPSQCTYLIKMAGEVNVCGFPVHGTPLYFPVNPITSYYASIER